MSYSAVGKQAKTNGVMPHPAIRKLLTADRPTPKVTGSKTRKRFGYVSAFNLGSKRHEYRHWFATEARRDQALAAARKQRYSTIEIVGPIERA